MRGGLKWLLSFALLLLALRPFSSQEPLLGDLLTQAFQAELRNRINEASSAYARALNLLPENPLLRLKYAEMLILLDRPGEAARQLVRALELFSQDPKASVELKRHTCDLLMGRLPAELRRRRMELGYDYEGWLFPAPFATLPVETQKRVLQLVPKEWLFPTKSSEAWFRLSVGEHQQGLSLLKEAVMEGEVTAAVHVLMSRSVTKEQRFQVVKTWLRDAESTGNPFLWLAALHMLWRTQQVDAFKNGFAKALQAVKDRPDLLLELFSLCEQMKWDEGRKQVLALLPPSLKPAPTAATVRKEFPKALDEGDLVKVKTLLLVLVDFPDQFRSAVLGADSIRKMLGHGWHDFVVELVQLDLVPELPYDTKQVLIQDAAFNPSRFSHWMRLFMSKPFGTPQETAVNLLEMTASQVKEPERAIWLLEQGLLMFPDEPRLLKLLASSYERAGYPARAVELLKALVRRSAKEGTVDGLVLSQLWDIAYRYQQLPQLVGWLKEIRNDLPLGYFVVIARLWMQHNKPQEALEWLDEAFKIAEKNGWLKDAEIHAMAYHLLRSPDPRDFERAQELRAKVARTNLLFHPDTYELRLSCLVRLGKKEEAMRVLDEATRLYPDHPFVKRVQGLAQSAVTDWSVELRNAKERWRKLAAPNCDDLIHLAYATFKAGKVTEAPQIADELMAGQSHWKEGYLLAVNMFEHRIKALLPFVRWVASSVPKDRFGEWAWTIDAVGDSIWKVGEPSLSGAFMLASVLLAPLGDREAEFGSEILIQDSASKWWSVLSPEDREELMRVLAKERLNQFVLNSMHDQGYLLNFPDGKTSNLGWSGCEKSRPARHKR